MGLQGGHPAWPRLSRVPARTSCGGVERDLALRDAHAIGTQVPQAQDALAVSHHGHADVLPRPGLRRGGQRCGGRGEWAIFRPI